MATANMYGSFLIKALNKELDWDGDTINVALVTSSYTPNQDTHDYWDDVVANEVANGNGYTTNGITLTSKTPLTMSEFPTGAYVAATNKIRLDAADVTWSSSTITARYAVIYDRSPASDATRPLLGYVDFGSNQSSSNGNFTITWDANGIFEITVA
jgi:hypothetical protein